MTMKTSIEVLTHYQCESCEQWWTIGDAPKLTYVYCPRCGLKYRATDYANECTAELARKNNELLAENDKLRARVDEVEAGAQGDELTNPI